MNQLADDYLLSLPKEKWCGDDLVYQFHGFWFMLPCLKGALQFLNNFKPLPTDVILASFPKTGTTWLKSLLFAITNRTSNTHPHDLFPTLELQVYSSNPTAAGNLTSCDGNARIFSTHVPYQFLSKSAIHSSECRIVYVTRNPKDTLISLWHYIGKSKMPLMKPWTIEDAVDKFCDGTDDTKNQVKKLAEFLGCPLDNEEEADEIVKICDIQTLKQHEVNKSSDLPKWLELPYNSYFRQGEVGDHKNYFDSHIIQRIDDMTKDKFHSAGFMFGL
ncbi:Sulfotransferase [Heracleum sosnowskyi]|uniref:Sulfotransferase n=1 Tax=Heracleum sosnowskyi TaxID=360622 RepID=A0AAD8MSA0_9APIA|nr:Sulfotransferase [Heracleum sosnowskyi]